MGGGFSKKKAASGGSRRMLENLPRERKGEAVGEYSVGRVIGLGSMGQIYLVHKKSNGRPYALKTIQLPRVCRTMLEELRNEISVLQTLTHPNIIRLHEVFHGSRRIQLILELCRGGDLNTRHPYTEAESGRIMKGIISAVAYMHSKGIAHRDIKCENILFEDTSPGADVKLLDFGLSSKYTEKGTSGIVGTPYSMAPEVVKDSCYTEACDLWSLGVVLYILLFREVPFHVQLTRDGSMPKIRYEPISSLMWNQTVDVSSAAIDLVIKLVVIDPKERLTAECALSHAWVKSRPRHSEPALGARKVVTSEIVGSMTRFGGYGLMKKTALMVMAHQCSPEQVRDLRDFFVQIDTENNGTVTVDELRSALVYQGLGEEAISTVFQNIDVDHSGRINYLEFLASTCETMGFLEEERLMEAFARLDEDANGYITSDELRALLGHEYSEADIEAMIREADTSGDGMIQYDEFARMMLGEKRRSSELQEVTQWVAKRGSTDSVPSRASSLKSSLRGRGQSASDNDRISLLEPSVAPGTATTDGG